MDAFFTKKLCDRCKKPLINGRIMSKLNKDCICPECSKEEHNNPKYSLGILIEQLKVEQGEYNYPGLYYKKNLPK